LSGKTAASLEVIDLERAIRQAILEFEPRILPGSLQVKAIVELNHLDHHNVIGIEIQGHLWAQPIPLELLIRTEIDLETGKVRVADLASARTV
jgi:type VI secretion system protein ImpF